MKNIKLLCDIMEQQDITPEELADRIGLRLDRLLEILAGSEPMATELVAIAEGLLLAPEEIDALFQAPEEIDALFQA